jgi:hypothetical protein
LAHVDLAIPIAAMVPAVVDVPAAFDADRPAGPALAFVPAAPAAAEGPVTVYSKADADAVSRTARGTS